MEEDPITSEWEKELCPITLTPLEEIGWANIEILPCTHKFEREAIYKSLSRGFEYCPVCKTPVLASKYGLTIERIPDEEDDSDGLSEYDEDSDEMKDFIVSDTMEMDWDSDYVPYSSDEDCVVSDER